MADLDGSGATCARCGLFGHQMSTCPEPPRKRRAVSGRHLGSAVCNALGLDEMSVRAVTINLTVDEVATVTVEMFIRAESGLETVLRRYELVEREDDAEVAA